MKRVILCANMTKDVHYNKDVHYIGVDGGALVLLEKNIPMDYAIGDFDSISSEQFAQLKEATTLIQLESEKDDSDSEHALKFALEHYDEVALTGVIGGRMDHFIAIYNLMAYQKLNFAIFDSQNYIYPLEVGEYRMDKRTTYLSFFACEDSEVTLQGVKYPLVHRKLSSKDVYTVSNEIIEPYAVLEVHSGRVIVIESDDANT
ncbi:thiamine pyrophosphokinase [Breznakia blatticola]|uniref:Thiamine diphosphokinase n=1 Tax=Breznakia blatticola TaxID=1754012 RepID=A0A4R7ZG68_9FIRM|nr:thiamine diphosphokinase [Breznakia blatticola]TDW16637.1 thiamine pyrophosphokinase [Breznakia blatticola]